jgi:uncharacterized membrane protein YphA (DoxX/SURF4 family)
MTNTSHSDRKRIIGYWILTALICLPMALGGVVDMLQTEQALEITRHLGYPDYFLVMLGVAKLLGVAAVLAPGLRRIKEWAYAGFAFDLVAAIVSHAAVGDPIADSVMPGVLFLILAGSYALRPVSRRLPE